MSQTKNLVLWISWKPRGSAERKVPCSSYQNTACTATSGLAVSVMGALILAELCKDARFPERVLNCGTLRAIFGCSCASGTKMTRRHRNFILSFGLWFPSDTHPCPESYGHRRHLTRGLAQHAMGGGEGQEGFCGFKVNKGSQLHCKFQDKLGLQRPGSK